METKINKKLFFTLIAIILIAIFSISVSQKNLQNDTFYTIKIGEHIIENGGIDGLDPFSWHQNLEYTYPHWLYDVMIYLIYQLGGMNGIYVSTCLFAIILGIVLFFTNTKLGKNKVISFVVTIGAMYMLRDYIAARAQLITYILLVLEVLSIEQYLDTGKKRYGLTLLIISILIANLHVAVWPFMFVLYLPYIAEYVIAAIERFTAHKYGKEVKQGDKLLIEYKEKTKWLIVIMLISILAGFLTPLGTTPYTYLLKTMQGNTTQNINEHLPLTLINNTDIICALIIFLALLIFTNSKIRLSDLLMLGGLTLLMLYSKRQSAIFVIIGAIILNKILYQWMEQCIPNIDEKMINSLVTKFGTFMIIALVTILSLYFIKPKLQEKYIDENSYPVEMSDFILNYFEENNININDVRIYNEYNYGSYLLYRNIPVFIDSRADLYSPEFNEGIDIFTDFINSSNLSVYFEDIFDKYDITHVLLYKNSKMNMIIQDANLNGYKLLKSDDSFVFYEIEK